MEGDIQIDPQLTPAPPSSAALAELHQQLLQSTQQQHDDQQDHDEEERIHQSIAQSIAQALASSHPDGLDLAPFQPHLNPNGHSGSIQLDQSLKDAIASYTQSQFRFNDRTNDDTTLGGTEMAGTGTGDDSSGWGTNGSEDGGLNANDFLNLDLDDTPTTPYSPAPFTLSNPTPYITYIRYPPRPGPNDGPEGPRRKGRGRPKGVKDKPTVDKGHRGRPKGAKNKKGLKEERERKEREEMGLPPLMPKKRGRPPGSVKVNKRDNDNSPTPSAPPIPPNEDLNLDLDVDVPVLSPSLLSPQPFPPSDYTFPPLPSPTSHSLDLQVPQRPFLTFPMSLEEYEDSAEEESREEYARLQSTVEKGFSLALGIPTST